MVPQVALSQCALIYIFVIILVGAIIIVSQLAAARRLACLIPHSLDEGGDDVVLVHCLLVATQSA
jgi:hypothetical protein